MMSSPGCGAASGATTKARGIDAVFCISPPAGIMFMVQRMTRGDALPVSLTKNFEVEEGGGLVLPPLWVSKTSGSGPSTPLDMGLGTCADQCVDLSLQLESSLFSSAVQLRKQLSKAAQHRHAPGFQGPAA